MLEIIKVRKIQDAFGAKNICSETVLGGRGCEKAGWEDTDMTKMWAELSNL